MNDPINPTHYSNLKIEPIDFITENKFEWEVGNIIKYVSRYKNKNKIEDLKKAQFYLEYLIKREKDKL